MTDQVIPALDLFQGSKIYDNFLKSFLNYQNFKPDLNQKEVSEAIYFHLCKMKYAGWQHRVNFNRAIKHSMSEIFQDLIAFYLKVCLPLDLYDVELEVKEGKLRPDIVIRKNKKYHFILEMKTNIGFDRNGPASGDFDLRINELSKAFDVPKENIIYVFEEHSNVSKEFSKMYWDLDKNIPNPLRPKNRPYSAIYPLFHSTDPYYWKSEIKIDKRNKFIDIRDEDIKHRASMSIVTPFEEILKLIQSC